LKGNPFLGKNELFDGLDCICQTDGPAQPQSVIGFLYLIETFYQYHTTT